MATADTNVRLEVRLPGSRPSFHEVNLAEYLIGSVPGCDLVIPGNDLPPVLGVIVRTNEGPRLRRLAPNLKLTINGKIIQQAPLNDGDAIGVGEAEIRVHIPAMAASRPVAATATTTATTKPWSFNIPLSNPVPVVDRAPVDPSGAVRQLQQESDRLKQQSRDIASRQQALDEEEQTRRMNWAEREAQLEAELEVARQRRRQAETATPQPNPALLVELDQRARELDEKDRQFTIDRTAHDAEVRAYRDDLVRLDRQRAALETRELELTSRAKHVDETYPLLESKSRQLELAEVQIRQDQERIRLSQSEIDVARASATQRLSDVERQEGVLRSLEERLERARQELTKQSQELADQKLRQDTRDRELGLRQQQLDGRHAELALREETNTRELKILDERQQAIDIATLQVNNLREQVIVQANDLKNREQRIALERSTLDEGIRVHREDLVRLDRFREALENREKQLTARAAEVEAQSNQVTLDLRALEDKHGQIALAEERLREEEEQVRKLKADLEANTNQLAERSATTEGQQAILVAVKAKLERLREELRVEAQAIADERGRQQTLEQAFIERQQAHEQLAVQMNATNEQHALVRQELEQKQKELANATEQMEAQRRLLHAEEAAIQLRRQDADAQASGYAEQATVLRSKAAQLLELQQRIEADQKSLAEREAALRDSDAACRALQEQLRQRAEEFASRQRAVDELAKDLAARAANLDSDRQKVDADLTFNRRDLDAKAAQLQALAAELHAREENCLRLANRIKEAGKSMAMDRKERHDLKAKWDDEHRRSAEELVRMRAELHQLKTEVISQAGALQQSFPELEQRGSAALDRLAVAREQLKNHVAELHDYARQSYDDLESLRTQVVTETERLREQQAGLAKARNDHRHTVTAFRQQLIDWQGKISEMKAGVVVADSAATRRFADAAAVEIEAASAAMARQTPSLPQASDKITDMKDWFRLKLKELAGTHGSGGGDETAKILPGQFATNATNEGKGESPPPSDQEAILAFTRELDPGDKKLGDLLRALDLADEKTLRGLWIEARRQRRSLRQVLLASGKLTVYQMALIEAGNVDGLTIGPLGVIDRLHVTPFESVYRVIDPRPGSVTGPVVLRHLAESAAEDSDKACEFRQCFKQLAELHHPHIVATIDVLDLNGRPAALQEWLAGLPSAEWPSLAAVPGVWFRLTCQALLGLATAHQAGLIHGAINARSAVLTAEGLVKLTGVGEPSWLSGARADVTAADDLVALGRLATDWAALSPKRKLAKPPRPLPNLVREVIDRWTAGGFTSANEVLDALDKAGSQVPAGAETWDRLMKYAGANATDGVAWRKSA